VDHTQLVGVINGWLAVDLNREERLVGPWEMAIHHADAGLAISELIATNLL